MGKNDYEDSMAKKSLRDVHEGKDVEEGDVISDETVVEVKDHCLQDVEESFLEEEHVRKDQDDDLNDENVLRLPQQPTDVVEQWQAD